VGEQPVKQVAEAGVIPEVTDVSLNRLNPAPQFSAPGGGGSAPTGDNPPPGRKR